MSDELREEEFHQNESDSEERAEEDTAGDEFPDENEDDLGDRVKRAASKMAKGLSSGAENVSSVVKRALQSRDHVLMVRINDEALQRITDLKDASLFRSRSEAAAYLIAEGIASKQDLFERIQVKIKQIQEIKDELRALAGADEEGLGLSPEENESEEED